MNFLDIAAVAVYFIGIIGFGCLFYGRSSTKEGFTSAGHRLPAWVVGMSIFGTYLSSITFLALPGKVYAGDSGAFAFSLSLPIAAYAAARWFTPLYRSSGDVSAYAYLERRFGLWARLYAAVCYLLTQQARMGAILFLLALALEGFTGWDISTVIIVTGAAVMIYTAIGGIEAVIWTDVAQSAVLTIGALASAAALMFGMPEGPGQLFKIAAENGKFNLGSMSLSLTSPTFWAILIYGVVINLQNFGIDQSYVQRYQAASSLTAAKKSVWIGAMLYIPVSALFLFIGAGLFAFYSAMPERLPAALHAPGMGDRVFPHFISTELHYGLTGLVIAALLAAAMSTISTSVNSSATILLCDFWERLGKKDHSDANQVRFLRIASLVIGAMGTGSALLMISVKTALDAWWNLAGIFSGGMLGLFLLGALSRRTTSNHAFIGTAFGIIVIFWATLSKMKQWPLANPLDPLMTTVIGTLSIFVIGAVLSRKSQRRGKSHPAETIFDL